MNPQRQLVWQAHDYYHTVSEADIPEHIKLDVWISSVEGGMYIYCATKAEAIKYLVQSLRDEAEGLIESANEWEKQID